MLGIDQFSGGGDAGANGRGGVVGGVTRSTLRAALVAADSGAIVVVRWLDEAPTGADG
jgi:hypothetical protein